MDIKYSSCETVAYCYCPRFCCREMFMERFVAYLCTGTASYKQSHSTEVLSFVHNDAVS
jgi:hypothetical protein